MSIDNDGLDARMPILSNSVAAYAVPVYSCYSLCTCMVSAIKKSSIGTVSRCRCFHAVKFRFICRAHEAASGP